MAVNCSVSLTPHKQPTQKSNNSMATQKKAGAKRGVKVRDLKPSKDAKGGIGRLSSTPQSADTPHGANIPRGADSRGLSVGKGLS